jgi:hypothetical protein
MVCKLAATEIGKDEASEHPLASGGRTRASIEREHEGGVIFMLSTRSRTQGHGGHAGNPRDEKAKLVVTA